MQYEARESLTLFIRNNFPLPVTEMAAVPWDTLRPDQGTQHCANEASPEDAAHGIETAMISYALKGHGRDAVLQSPSSLVSLRALFLG